MMRTQCLLGLRTFVAFAAKLWSFFIYLLRRQIRTVIQYQTVRYDILPLSPVSRNRLSQVKRKILVLDLDETLIHSHHDGVLRPTVRPGTPPDFILKVVIDKHPVRFFVHKRPHVDFFLEVVSQWYELVVFTASMEIYGSAVADKLDNSRSILRRRYYSTALWNWAATSRTSLWSIVTSPALSSWITPQGLTGAIQTMPSPSNPGSVTLVTPPSSTCFQCWMPSGSPLMFVLC
ncbi:CTD nuclear envelope phosphatase 1 isoform X2 [Erinaceus europaeus]|uniref:Mitochondrial import inner membrane translocase subunit TIM50 n=1 Tax=Erinaceus europaeus TaxID=9365 RepID=A0ABM3YGR3_ERIEU|nr:CTD nuclear envelope phosphatase 1 isoform X2 [Erinaceus europaeus]